MSDQTDEALARELLEGLPWHRPSPVLLRWKTRWIADALPDVIALLRRIRQDERQKRGKCLYCDDTAKAVYPVCYKHRNADLRKQ